MPLNLPARSEKPRGMGLTMIHDVGITRETLRALLSDYSSLIDIAKFGIGTAYVAPNLLEKVQLYKEHGIEPYFGGTLFEKYHHSGKLDEYLEFLHKNSIQSIEISTGTISIPFDQRLDLVRGLQSDFKVYAEVGSKDQEAIMPPSRWVKEIKFLIDAGASYVITEGRESASAGVYRPSGEVRTGLIEDLVDQCDVRRIIFEAPTAASQAYFINLVGANVNLGNISPNDALRLEAQRVGLRSETFFVVKR